MLTGSKVKIRYMSMPKASVTVQISIKFAYEEFHIV